MRPENLLGASLIFAALGTPLGLEAAQSAPPGATLVYRCTLPGGGRTYTSKPLAGDECVPISYVPVPPEWEYVTSSNYSSVYVRTESITRVNGAVAAWLLDNFVEPQISSTVSAPYLSSLRRITVKCNTREINHQTIVYYSGASGLGDHLGRWRAVFANGDFAAPGTVDDLIASRVCLGKSSG